MRTEIKKIFNNIKQNPQNWKLCYDNEGYVGIRRKWYFYPYVGLYGIQPSLTTYIHLQKDEMSIANKIIEYFESQQRTNNSLKGLVKLKKIAL